MYVHAYVYIYMYKTAEALSATMSKTPSARPFSQEGGRPPHRPCVYDNRMARLSSEAA